MTSRGVLSVVFKTSKCTSHIGIGLELIDSGHPVNWEGIRPWRDQNSYGKLPDMRPFSLKLPK